MAVPSAVEYRTVTVWPAGLASDTLNSAAVLPLSPSPTVTSAMEIAAWSSSVMVASAAPSASEAPAGSLSVTSNVSSGSSIVSPLTGTVIVRLVCPGAKVRLPDVAV